MTASSIPDSTGSGSTFLLTVTVLGALLLAAGVLAASISAIAALIGELLGALFSSLGALLLIGLAIVCVILLAAAGFGSDSPPLTAPVG